MSQRWVTFFLIFFVAYFVVIARYQQRRAEWERSQQTAAAVVADDAPAERRAPVDRPAAWDGDAAAPDVRADRPAAFEDFEAPAMTRFDAPIEVVDTGFARIEFSRLGAVPIRWQILPSENLAPIIDRETGEPVYVDLIPQVGGDNREFPFMLEGPTVRRFNEVLFDVERSRGPGGEEVLRFVSPEAGGVQLIKTFSFAQDSYLANLEVEILNGEARVSVGDREAGWGIGWQGGFFQPEPQSRLTGRVEVVLSQGENLRTRSLGFDSTPETFTPPIGWAGIQKKYFAAVLVPDPANMVQGASAAVRGANVTREYRMQRGIPAPMSLVMAHPGVELPPGGEARVRYTLFVGPKDFRILQQSEIPMLAGSLPLQRLAFGQMIWGMNWVRPISIFLLRALRFFHDLLDNWGLAIIVLVLVVKTVLYPLSHWAIKNQAKTMAEQMKIRPFLDEINKKYKDDPQKKSQEMMKLYREHNINPLGMLRGCFPMLLQMPIFFGLFILLDQAVELRGQQFLWMADLSMPDRLVPFGFMIPILRWDALNILPLLMAGTQFIVSRMMTANIQDPMQKQIMYLMPIMFTILLYNMPSGLMLYWVVQNVWQIGHTALTKRYVFTHDAAPVPAAKPAA